MGYGGLEGHEMAVLFTSAKMSFLPQTYLKWLTSHCRAERCRSIALKANRMTNRHSVLSTWRYFSYQFFYGYCYLLL